MNFATISEALLESRNLTCSWWPSDFNDNEYCAVLIRGTWEQARVTCQDLGGILAYEGFGNVTEHKMIYENLMTQISDLSEFYFGAYYKESNASSEIYGLTDGRLLVNSSRLQKSDGIDSIGCMRYCNNSGANEKWCVANCDWDGRGAICQRPKSKLSFRTLIAILQIFGPTVTFTFVFTMGDVDCNKLKLLNIFSLLNQFRY